MPGIEQRSELEPSPAKIAIIFQGQSEGGVDPRVVKEFYGQPAARAVFDRADQILGVNLTRMMMEGESEEYGQVAAVVTSLAIYEEAKVRKGKILQKPAFVAGSSLGQFTAIIAAKTLPMETGLPVLEDRQRVTRESQEINPGGMVALIGLGRNVVAEVCRKTGVYIANINSPELHLVSGTVDRIPKVLDYVSNLGKGEARSMVLPYGSHCRIMKPTIRPFKEKIDPIEFKDPEITVVLNETGKAAKSGEDIKKWIVYQLTIPVRLQQSIQFMAQNGVRRIIEIGAGRRVIAGLPHRIDEKLTGECINSLSSIEKLTE